MVKYIAIAASAALPPADRMSRPIRAACGSSAATAPRKPSTAPTVPGAGVSDEQPAIIATLSAQSVI